MNISASNIQIVNKENQYGRISPVRLWSDEDLHALLYNKIPEEEHELILNKFISMMEDAKICFNQNLIQYPISHALNKRLVEKNDFLTKKEKSKIENYMYDFHIYKISIYCDSYAKSYPKDFITFSEEETGIYEWKKFVKTQGYQDFLFLKKWLNKKWKNKKFNPDSINKIINGWGECEVITLSKIGIFIESESYAIFNTSKNGYLDRYNECGILSNAMIFDSEQRALNFAKGKYIESVCYIVKLKIEVESVTSEGSLVGNHRNDFKESLAKRESEEMIGLLKSRSKSIEKLPKKRL